jgi:hypothetical protein
MHNILTLSMRNAVSLIPNNQNFPYVLLMIALSHLLIFFYAPILDIMIFEK